MAKDRITVCTYYLSYGAICEKGRKAEHNGYCQKCDKYVPRVHEKHINKKKQKLDKIRRNEKFD